jgi:N-acetylmuramoyl-L-alanine amidase
MERSPRLKEKTLQIIFFIHVWGMGKWGFVGLFFLLWSLVASAKLTDLAEIPDWSRLDRLQKSISKQEFLRQLNQVYCPRKSWWSPWIEIEENRARIRKKAGSDEWYNLQFLESNETINLSLSRFQISGTKILIDPGHIGGEFSEMEGRHFAIGGDNPVKEGDLALSVALKLKSELEKKGAVVSLSRKENQPVTQLRPKDFKELAENWFSRMEWLQELPSEERSKRIQKKQELYFYRVSEIMARSEIIRKSQPDLVLCIHLNAAPWPDPDNKSLVTRNDYHVLVNGCYMGGEIAYDNQRFEMIWRLLHRWEGTERLIAEHMSQAFAKETGLPAFAYKGPNALKIGKVEGVWARNLLANRMYEAPVIFLEPYIANSEEVYKRIQGGDSDPHDTNEGQSRKSLIKEYVDAVVLGLENADSQK